MMHLKHLALAWILTCAPAFAESTIWTTTSDFEAGTSSDVIVSDGGVQLGITSGWYSADWAVRTPIEIAETSGTALEDYSVRLSVDTATLIDAALLRSDGADLRFVDPEGAALGHWVESGMDSTATVVWVRVNSIPADGSTTIWMYSGNPDAADVSDRSDAMLWYDDFSSGSLDAYVSQGLDGFGNDNWGISSGWAYNLNSIYSSASLLVAGLDLSGDYLVETRAYTFDDDGLGVIGNVGPGGDSYYCAQTWDDAASRNGICRDRSEGDAIATAGIVSSAGEANTYGMTFHDDTVTMYFNEVERVSYTDPSPLSGTRIGFLSNKNEPAGFFDYLLIRRYVDPEPTGTAGTPEALLLGSGTWTSPVVSSECAYTTWEEVSWSETLADSTDITVAIRTGPSTPPDGSWTGWTSELSDPEGSASGLDGGGAYARVRVSLTGDGAGSGPRLEDLTFHYTPFEDLDEDGHASVFCGGEDCDDDNPDTHPDATETCDGIDNDCDGIIDPDSAAGASTWYADADADGFGDADSTSVSCEAADGWVADSTDCDDTDGAVNPDATEVCDGIDNDCDGATDPDSSVGAPTWYADTDGDGFGDMATTSVSCEATDGWVADSADCDDTDGAVNPDAAEVCDGIDNDCDGSTDPDDAIDVPTWYADTDGDGFGDAASTLVTCFPGEGWVLDSDDCDDLNADVYPDAPGLDADCVALEDTGLVDDTGTADTGGLDTGTPDTGATDSGAGHTPSDTGDPADPVSEERGPVPLPAKESGCGCAAAYPAGRAAWCVSLLALLGFIRRRGAHEG